MKDVEIIERANENYIKKACAYVRVSTKYASQENSFKNQYNYWAQKINQDKIYEFVGIFADEGISGKNIKDRLQFNEMILKACNNEINIIFTKSISRFARNLVETLSIIKELKKHNVEVIFEKENIKSFNEGSNLLLSIISSVAETEIYSMSDNMKWAIRKRFQKGITKKYTKTFGLQVDENFNLIIFEPEAEIVRLIFNLYLNGNGLNKITKELYEREILTPQGKPKWSQSTLIRIIKNEKYIGDLLLQKFCNKNFKSYVNNNIIPKYYIKNNHDNIINRNDFEKVQQLLIQRRLIKDTEQSSNRYDLTSQIICGKCGKNFRRYKTKDIIYWRCKTSRICRNHKIDDSVIRGKLVEIFNEYLTNKIEFEVKNLKMIIEKESKIRLSYFNNIIQKDVYEKMVSETILKSNYMKRKIREFNLKKVIKFDNIIIKSYMEKIMVQDRKITIIFKDGEILHKNYLK